MNTCPGKQVASEQKTLSRGFRAWYVDYPMSISLNWLWNFGAILMVVLALMLVTGIFLAVHYTPTAHDAFASVEAIDRQVPDGWLLHSIHNVGASLFLASLYIHVFRGLYYGSYKRPRELLWLTGVVLLCMVMLTAFAGYVLPWGQLSFWGASVVSKAMAALPMVGNVTSQIMLGGDSPGDATLHRLFVLHFVVAFAIVGVVGAHIAVLHARGSGNPDGLDASAVKRTVPFHPYFTSKDAVGLTVFLLIFAIFVFFFPEALFEAENYRPANPLHTPADIEPQWYFLPFYGMLQAVPSRLGGLLASIGAIAVLFAVPWLDTSSQRSARKRPIYRISMVVLAAAFVMLGLVGRHHAMGGWLITGRIAVLLYFAHFLVIMPMGSRLERRHQAGVDAP